VELLTWNALGKHFDAFRERQFSFGMKGCTYFDFSAAGNLEGVEPAKEKEGVGC
jgi:hypothetical protein